jgi:hypothetical protein
MVSALRNAKSVRLTSATVSSDTAQELMKRLRRHVGHQLRCLHETSGAVGGYVIATVCVRCEDCGETVIDGHATVLQKDARRG